MQGANRNITLKQNLDNQILIHSFSVAICLFKRL